MTKALVIKTMGDASMAGAIADAMTQRIIPINSREVRALRAERDRLLAQKTLRNFGDDQRWRRTKRRMARKYRVKQHGKLYWAVVKPWALLWYGIDIAAKSMMAWNRR